MITSGAARRPASMTGRAIRPVACGTVHAVRLLLLCALLAACGGADRGWGGTMTDSAGVVVVQNPADGNWTLEDRPELVEELRIGVDEGEPAYQFGQIGSIDVAEDGTIHVLDVQARNVRVFDVQGRHLRTIGRPGTGPGELSQAPMAVLAGREPGAVYVADMMRQRIVAFGVDGNETGSTALMLQTGIPVRFQPLVDGRWAVQVRAMQLPGMTDTVAARDRILLRDPASEAADTALELESGRTFDFQGGAPRMRIFSSEPMWTVLSDGRLVHGRNDTFRLEVLDHDGTLQRVITRQVERKPVGEADRQAILTLLRQQAEQQGAPPAAVQQFMQNIQFADHYPTFFQLLGGPDGRLWVQRVATADEAQRAGRTFDAQDIGSATWDVLDEEGRLLGSVTMPPRFMPMTIEGDRIYGVLRDELDVQYVVRLRIE